MVLNLSHNINHNNTAYELFFKSGPLAILPMKKNYSKTYNSSIVWTHSAEYFNNLILKDNLNRKQIQKVKKFFNKIELNKAPHILINNRIKKNL